MNLSAVLRKENTKNLHGENFMGYPTLYFKLLRTERREAINFARHRLIYLVACLKSIVILLLVGSCGNAVEYTSMNFCFLVFQFLRFVLLLDLNEPFVFNRNYKARFDKIKICESSVFSYLIVRSHRKNYSF